MVGELEPPPSYHELFPPWRQKRGQKVRKKEVEVVEEQGELEEVLPLKENPLHTYFSRLIPVENGVSGRGSLWAFSSHLESCQRTESFSKLLEACWCSNPSLCTNYTYVTPELGFAG